MYIFIDELLHLFLVLAHFPQVHNQKNHTGPGKQGSTHELTDSTESLQVSKTWASRGQYSGNSTRLPFKIIMLPFLSCPPAQEYIRTTFFLPFTHEHKNRYDGHYRTKMLLKSVMSDQVHESIS